MGAGTDVYRGYGRASQQHQPPQNRYDFALKVIFQYGVGSFLACYLVYNLVQVFLPALVGEMRETNSLLSGHVESGRAVELGIPILINLSTQDCINNAQAVSDTRAQAETASRKCFGVARGDAPSR